MFSPPGGHLNASTPVRVATTGEVDPSTCPQEDQSGLQGQTLTPKPHLVPSEGAFLLFVSPAELNLSMVTQE